MSTISLRDAVLWSWNDFLSRAHLFAKYVLLLISFGLVDLDRRLSSHKFLVLLGYSWFFLPLLQKWVLLCLVSLFGAHKVSVDTYSDVDTWIFILDTVVVVGYLIQF